MDFRLAQRSARSAAGNLEPLLAGPSPGRPPLYCCGVGFHCAARSLAWAICSGVISSAAALRLSTAKALSCSADSSNHI